MSVKRIGGWVSFSGGMIGLGLLVYSIATATEVNTIWIWLLIVALYCVISGLRNALSKGKEAHHEPAN